MSAAIDGRSEETFVSLCFLIFVTSWNEKIFFADSLEILVDGAVVYHLDITFLESDHGFVVFFSSKTMKGFLL